MLGDALNLVLFDALGFNFVDGKGSVLVDPLVV